MRVPRATATVGHVVVALASAGVVYASSSCSLAKTAQFSCGDSQSEVEASGAACVADRQALICTGYVQASANNQDPILVRFDSGMQTWCTTLLETTNDDSRGEGLVWDTTNDVLYGFFTSTGTQPGDGWQRFATNGWLSSYGPGGGAKVAVVARIDATNGVPDTATFVSAELSNGQTNSVTSVVAAGFGSSQSLVLGLTSAFHARNTDGTRKDCDCTCDCCESSDFYDPCAAWNWQLELSADLSSALSSFTPACDPVGTLVSNVDDCGDMTFDWSSAWIDGAPPATCASSGSPSVSLPFSRFANVSRAVMGLALLVLLTCAA